MEIFLKAKELISFTYTISDNWPKKYRFDLTNRVRNTSLDVYEKLIEANEIFVDTKLIDDLRISINHIRNQKLNDDFMRNKLLTLQITKANKIDERINKRRDKQNQAFSGLKKLDFFFSEAYSRHLINSIKWEKVSSLINDITKLLKAWINSDKKRFQY